MSGKASSYLLRNALLFLSALVGATVLTYLRLQFLDDAGFPVNDASNLLALIVGLLFALFGLRILGLVTFAADAEVPTDSTETERRRIVRAGALMILFVGAGLVVLALGDAGPAGRAVSANYAAWLGLACFVVATLAFFSVRESEYFDQKEDRSESNLGHVFDAVTSLAMLWAILAELRLAPSWGLGVLAGILGIRSAYGMAGSIRRVWRSGKTSADDR